MKIKRFNENEDNIYIYYKLYGENYRNIENIFKDLRKFDKNKVKYDIYTTTNNSIIGVFAYIPGNLSLGNIPIDYNMSIVYDNISDYKKMKINNNKNIIQKEDILPLIQANKFNI